MIVLYVIIVFTNLIVDCVLFAGQVSGGSESTAQRFTEAVEKSFGSPHKQVIFTSPRDWLYSAWNYVCVTIQTQQLPPLPLDIDGGGRMRAVHERSLPDS